VKSEATSIFSDGLLIIPEKRSFNKVYEEERGIAWLEVLHEDVFLHTALFANLGGLSYLKDARAILFVLETELLCKGIRNLYCFVEDPEAMRYAEFFGFEPIYDNNDNLLQNEEFDYVMKKDLHCG
jgi:hypothetical protein